MLGRFSAAAEVAAIAIGSTEAVERALGLGVLAKVRLREGSGEGEELITRAVEIVEATDFLLDRATIQLDLAAASDLRGRKREARTARELALELLEAKGDVVSAARVRESLSA